MEKQEERLQIRHATLSDLDALTQLEACCFPAAEAASREAFAERIRYYGNHFYLLWDDHDLIAFVDGFVTDQEDLTDDMYADAGKHMENGSWQMIFGVNTHPEKRHQGYATRLLQCMIDDAKAQGRKGLVLTCKEALIPFYARLGFVSEGISSSDHGGATWYQMRKCL